MANYPREGSGRRAGRDHPGVVARWHARRGVGKRLAVGPGLAQDRP